MMKKNIMMRYGFGSAQCNLSARKINNTAKQEKTFKKLFRGVFKMESSNQFK